MIAQGGIEMFWLKLGLFLVILFALISLLKFFLRKLFNIKKEKKEFFSYNHINNLHKKIDWLVRWATTLALITILYLVMYREYPVTLFLIALILLTAIDYSVRAFFEWKYSDNPKQAILTIGEMVVFVAVLALTIQFDWLNLGF